MAISKFDAKQHIPYGCILHCLSSILKQILTESEYEVQHFSTELREIFGPQSVNVQLMFDFVPELKSILADMPDLPAIEKLPFVESVARFHSVNNITLVKYKIKWVELRKKTSFVFTRNIVCLFGFWGKLGGLRSLTG